MATGIKRLRKIQFGPEATAGTAVAATLKWRGPGIRPEALNVIEFVEEDVGRFGGANRSAEVSREAQLALPDTALTFEQLPIILQCGIEAQQTGVADGAGTGLIYTFDFPLLLASTIKTWTVEGGNNEDCADMEYAFCEEFLIKGSPKQNVVMGGLLRGRQFTPGQSFAALTVTAVDEAPFNKSKLYLDAAGGSMGGTQVDGAFLGFTVNVMTGLKAVFSGDGELYFYIHEQVGWEITADIVFKHTADADTEHVNWLAQTARLLEITLEGAALTTAGAYTYKTVRIQLPGKWQKFAVLGEQDGVDILTGTFRAAYDPTASLGPTIVVVNETASYWA